MKILRCHRVVTCLVIPVWILAIHAWGGAVADAQAAGDNAHAAPEFQSLFDGQSLTGWKIADFGGQEDITVQDGVIQAAMGYPLAGIVYEADELPVDDYILELSACKREGTDFFCCLTFPVRDQFCSLVLGGWGGTVTGITSINGEDASENATRTLRRYEAGQWYRVRVQVHDNRLVCHIDGEQIVDVELQDVKLSLHPAIDHCRPLSISAFETRAAWKDIQLARLAGGE